MGAASAANREADGREAGAPGSRGRAGLQAASAGVHAEHAQRQELESVVTTTYSSYATAEPNFRLKKLKNLTIDGVTFFPTIDDLDLDLLHR